MLDDDIQYMGTRAATSDSPFLGQKTLSGGTSQSKLQASTDLLIPGIVLHIEKSPTDTAYDLIYRRTNTNVVEIGRRPGTEAERRQGHSVGAMFRCAVVSRKHAKIAFSDSGHVRFTYFSYHPC